MMKKPKTQEEPVVWPDPPDHLSEWSKTRWRLYVGQKIKSPGGIDLLELALQAWDTAQIAQEAIDRDGLVLVTEKTGTGHAHPMLKVQRESRQLFAKLWKELGLHRENRWC